MAEMGKKHNIKAGIQFYDYRLLNAADFGALHFP
jgi:hypothetical protein